MYSDKRFCAESESEEERRVEEEEVEEEVAEAAVEESRLVGESSDIG